MIPKFLPILLIIIGWALLIISMGLLAANHGIWYSILSIIGIGTGIIAIETGKKEKE